MPWKEDMYTDPLGFGKLGICWNRAILIRNERYGLL